MSNELLMEMFEYYDLYSLFFSFCSLNSRIDNILHYCQVSIDLDLVQPIDLVDFLAHTLSQINPKNIRSLHASKSHQIMVLAFDKSLIYFTYIRSLSLSNIQSSIIESMVSRIHFSHLERVLIDKCGIYCNNIGSFFKHFLDSNQYHYLQTYKDFDSKTDNVTSVLLIEHLTMSSCTPCNFLNILNQSSYLKYVKTSLNFNDQYSEPIFIFPIPHYHALTHLNLNWYRPACMKTIDYLFEYVPRIHHFKLQANVAYQREHVEPIFWETFLRKNLAELK
ncbi:unnamed protein product [Rotaria sp. Silwood1]|nr:unnamed protein product [Rotaria sp. Silwood1]